MKVEWYISGNKKEWEQRSNTGGAIYEDLARKVLRSMCELEVTYLSRGNSKSKLIKFFQFCRYVLKNMSVKYKGDIMIRDVFSTVFAPFDKKKINIVLIHHLDISKVNNSVFYKLFEKLFFKRVCLADGVVVVSEYWENKLEAKGCSNVNIIYNSFDLDTFKFDKQELLDFKRGLEIPEDKPIIYLGNARLEKGYIETYKALKDLDAVLVTTGEKSVVLPVLHKYLNYPDYLKLLKISSLVLTMSKFSEGWCRTAHEAMLCGTPVIGSGRGGMKELLDKGGQMICSDFALLKPLVLDLLSNKGNLRNVGVQGKEFAVQFSLEYLKNSWVELISRLTRLKREENII